MRVFAVVCVVMTVPRSPLSALLYAPKSSVDLPQSVMFSMYVAGMLLYVHFITGRP
jgi:hypothetical protein